MVTETVLEKKTNEHKLIQYLFIIEANYHWAKSFFDLVLKHKNELKDNWEKYLFTIDVFTNPLTSLTQHYNQIYFNNSILYFSSLLSNDTRELCIKKYIKDYAKGDKKKSEALITLIKNYTKTSLFQYRHNFIAHINYKQVNSVYEITSGFIDLELYKEMEDMLELTIRFMKQNFSVSHEIYLKNENSFVRNDYRDRHNSGITILQAQIEKEIQKLVKYQKSFNGRKRKHEILSFLNSKD